MRRAKTHTRPRTAGSGRHGRPLRTTRPHGAELPVRRRGEQAGITGHCAGLGRRWQSLPKVGTAYQMPPMRSSATSPPAGYATRTRGPGCRQIHSKPVSNLPAWGRYQRPHYTVQRGLVDRPDGAKSAVGMCGPRVTQGPLPVGHAPLRATTVPGVCGPRGPPMAHQKSDEWAIGKP